MLDVFVAAATKGDLQSLLSCSLDDALLETLRQHGLSRETTWADVEEKSFREVMDRGMVALRDAGYFDLEHVQKVRCGRAASCRRPARVHRPDMHAVPVGRRLRCRV